MSVGDYRPEYRKAGSKRRCPKCGWNEHEFRYGDQYEICPTCNHTPLETEIVPRPKKPFDWEGCGATIITWIFWVLIPLAVTVGGFMSYCQTGEWLPNSF